jgi:carboxyl-terminal processing protease
VTARRTALSRLVPVALLAVGLALVARGSLAQPGRDAQLADLAVFNRVVVLVKEQYVEPNRIRPVEMLRAALDAVEKEVPEVLVDDIDDDNIRVSVGSPGGLEVRDFTLRDIRSLWEMSFRLQSIFRFLEPRISADVDRREVEYAAVNGMLGKLDPHSVLLEPRFSQEMKLSTKGEFGGLGIVISIRDGGLTVISPIEGTPADGVGIKAQDKIVKIGEESTVNMGLDEAVERLRGKPGTTVTIWVLRKGWEEARRFDIVRAVIKVDAVTSERIGDLAYVKIKQFAGHVAEDVAAGVEKAAVGGKAPLQGVILDLRNNPGGLLDQAIEVSNLFLRDGVLVVTQEGQGKDGRREALARPGNHRIDLPVVVLVNGGSASASEIVAGALKNRERGFIIGDQTFGKGSVQQLYDFPDSSSLKLTIGQYLTPGDESIQSVGITPDLQLNPILAADKENLNVLPDEHTREEDLDGHLDDARTRKNRPAYDLAYLAEVVDADEAERRDANSRFVEDFEIRLARRVLEAAAKKGMPAARVGRAALRETAGEIVAAAAGEEQKRIAEALGKLGIDWSSRPATASPGGTLAVAVVDARPARAGETLSMTLEAKNTGTAPLFRVRGNTEATLGYLADREFLFGQLAPGESRRFTVDVKIPRELQGRRDLVRVAVADDQRALTAVDIPVDIEGQDRPRFAYSLFIDDGVGKDTVGNGDGLLQVGENVALVVGIKNTGLGNAAEPTALIKNLGGAEVFIDVGRQRLEALGPGASGVARFTFRVVAPPGQTMPDKVALRLQVFDSVLGDYLVEKLAFPVRPATTKAKKTRGIVQANAAVPVLAAADAGARIVGRLDSGARAESVGAVNGFVQIHLGGGNLYGFVAEGAVAPSRGAVTNAPGTPQGLSIVYGRDPPVITFVDAGGKALREVVTTTAATFDVDARITDDGPVADSYIFVGDQKVFYQRLAGSAGRGPTATALKHRVTLKPGVNVITVVAREDDEFAQREVLTVFSTKGDPFAERKQRGH